MSTNLNKTMDVLAVAHITLEYKLGVGGIKSVTTGLIPALLKKGISPSVITPYYDVYDNFYDKSQLQHLATITHIYKGKPFKSDVWQVCTDIVDDQPIYHYLIRPVANSSVARLFEIGDEKDMYRSFPHSDSQNRVEYFNGAVASMIRMPYDNIPEFDIIHGHTWHTGLSGCLIKEFENLPPYQDLIKAESRPLKKIPHVAATIHMLLKGHNGPMNSKEAIAKFTHSVGLPEDFATKFTKHSQYINATYLNQVVLTLLYADQVNTVSKGLAEEAISGKGEGLDDLLQDLHSQSRLIGITNGITFNTWDATNPDNLQEYAFNLNTVLADKQRLKEHLVTLYPNLDANKKWFIFIGRFANEKGVDYLKDLLSAVNKVNGNLIVLGSHVVTTIKNDKVVSRYQDEIDFLKSHANVVVIDDPTEQKKIGKKFRAASNVNVNLSKNEACGIVPMESFPAAVYAVAPRIQGLPDTVIPLTTDKNGTGFLYDADPANRAQSLEDAIFAIVDFLDTQAKNQSLNASMSQLMLKSQQFDWESNSAIEYKNLYQTMHSRELLTFDKIRSTPKPVAPLLPQFNGTTTKETKPLEDNNKIKIWQIGFNKAGSQTLFYFFIKNKIPSVHYGLKNKPIADAMYSNFINDQPLVAGEFDKYTAYFDMENPYSDPPIYIGPSFFKELDAQYPGSKFILNTRNKDAWLRSRCRHKDPNKGLMYLDVACEKYNLSKTEIIAKWSREWDEHHAAVIEHFKDRPNDLLIFDIDKDGPEKIQEFFKEYFILDPSLYEHANKTETTKPTFAHG